jgi:hypothetical protein
MSHVSSIVGNIYIKHVDHSSTYYLCEDLSFTLDKTHAAKFYILKHGTSTIVNGDRISLNLGNKCLAIDSDNIILFLDRNQLNGEIATYIITNGTENNDYITHDSPLFLITDVTATHSHDASVLPKISDTTRYALKYDWSFDVNMSPPVTRSRLINANYATNPDPNVYQFQFERTEPGSDNHKSLMAKTYSAIDYIKHFVTTSLETYKGAIVVVILIIILILCIILGR